MQADVTAAALLPISQLSQADADEYFAFLVSIFPHRTRQYFEAHLYADPEVDFSSIFVIRSREAVVEDQSRSSRVGPIVATARIHWRWVWVGSVERLAGIGEVATLPAFRGRGLATRLLQRCWEQIEERGVRLSALHTRSAVPLYRKLGWEAIPIRWCDVTVRGSDDASAQQEVKRLCALPDTVATSTSDSCASLDAVLAHLAALHALAPRQPGLLERSAAYWQRWLGAALRTTAVACFYSDDAYVALRPDAGAATPTARLLDVGWRTVDAFVSILRYGARAMAGDAASQSAGVAAEEVPIRMPRGIAQHLPAVAVTAVFDAPTDEGMMWRGDEALLQRLRAVPEMVFLDADLF